MNLTITPGKLAGTVTPPPSKSQAHRCLIAAALAGEGSVIHNLAGSQDIRATRRCMEELKTNRNTLLEFNCGESGSTLRFLIPIALALRGGGIFTGQGRLMERPQQPYFDLFDEKGIRYEQRDGVLTVEGRLTPGEYRLPGNVSSQFFTGLLMALPLLDGPSAIIPTTPLESEGYIGMTLDVMHTFGIDIASTRSLPPHYLIPGGFRYRSAEVTVEGDWSQAAFWYAANCLGCAVNVRGVTRHSTQGDRIIESHCLELSQPGDTEIDMSGCPDLAPPVAAAAAVRRGNDPAGQRRTPAHQGERPALHHRRRPERHGGAGDGVSRQSDRLRAGQSGGRVYRGLLQRPPHRHDGGSRRHPLPGAGDASGGGVRGEILSRFLGTLPHVRRRFP